MPAWAISADPAKFEEAPYVGKDYGERNSEVTSMGYQRMVESMRKFNETKADREMFYFLLGQLAGK